MTEHRPWQRFYGSVPPNLEYPEVTLFEALERTARRVPGAIAWTFFGTRATYAELLHSVERFAAALDAGGLCAGDRFLISMPTTPQGVIAFYAANRLGALPALVHPLSTASELTHYLDATGARMALVLDAFFGTLACATPKRALERIVVAGIPEYLSPLKRLGFWATKGRKIPPLPGDARIRRWNALMGAAPTTPAAARRSTDDPAAILFSGGTTALPKGIVLSNRNLISEGMQASSWCNLSEGDSILAVLPLFHGFGLGVCVNAAFMAGGRSILVPQFSAKVVAKLIRSERPNVLVGVPTLFDALGRDPSLEGVDLSCLKACFCGADTLPRPVKERFEARVAAGGGRVKLLEGYGLTEAVTGIMATPLSEYREGSIGIPFPDMRAKIVKLGTTEEAPIGEEGEICVAGPAVMLGYLDDPEATAQAVRTHADGRKWLHTGDLGRMDADGFFYFTVRLKRMIKSSGFNVYPAQVEAVLREHPEVAEACVVGVPDPQQVERVVACIVARNAAKAGPALAEALIAHCREKLIKWSCPREVDFVDSLPVTKVGKIDYRELVRRHAAKEAAANG
jgi:long-chain acyl-CoA synthetase